jgi:predicted small metal-binding protein
VSCSWEGRAESEKELIDKVLEHITRDHQSCTINDAMMLKIRAFIRDED